MKSHQRRYAIAQKSYFEQYGLGETVEDASPILGRFERTLTEIDGVATLNLRVSWPADDNELPTVEYLSVEFRHAGTAPGSAPRTA